MTSMATLVLVQTTQVMASANRAVAFWMSGHCGRRGYGATIWMRERDDQDEKSWGRG
jgi:hypothetical protein